jgi:hypothetical protein
MAADWDVDLSGVPFLQPGRAQAAVARFAAEVTDEVSAQLIADWHQNLDRSIRHPTPYYETQLVNQRVEPTLHRVHDRGVVYGPWLEGTSSRNRTTRFRGYSSLRRARQSTVARIPSLVAIPLRRFIAAVS